MMYCYCKISKKGNLYHIYDFMASSESNHKIVKKVTYSKKNNLGIKKRCIHCSATIILYFSVNKKTPYLVRRCHGTCCRKPMIPLYDLNSNSTLLKQIPPRTPRDSAIFHPSDPMPTQTSNY